MIGLKNWSPAPLTGQIKQISTIISFYHCRLIFSFCDKFMLKMCEAFKSFLLKQASPVLVYVKGILYLSPL